MQDNVCKYGRFDLALEGGYTITDTRLPSSWEFIYQNRDILLRADQCGVVNAQAVPPQDIMLVRRNSGERTSRWQVWIGEQHESFVSNFGFPRGDKIPLSSSITFLPECASYKSAYENFEVLTELSVPNSGISAVMTTTLTNTCGTARDFRVVPVLEPYVNQAVMAPWDKPEWYLSTAAGKTAADNIEFFTHLGSPNGDHTKRRMVTFSALGADAENVEIDYNKFIGCGSFDCPDALKSGLFSYKTSDLESAGVYGNQTVYGYPPIFAIQYKVTLLPGESKKFTQVLSMQNPQNCGIYNKEESLTSERFLLEDVKEAERKKNRAFFDRLFNLWRIETDDILLNKYVNSFLPLQMYWVASLDRGWPTGMRGVRDASNDFMGMLLYNPDWSRKVLLELFSCQRADGWLPRQISTSGVKGKHDLRAYCDGGAFALEFLYQYLCYTADASIFDEKTGWLDSETDSTVYEHWQRALDWYLDKENIGVHGLCKIYEGDWLDAVNRAGLCGKGESVTVTAQTIMNLFYAQKILTCLKGDTAAAEIKRYQMKAESFKKAMNASAFNKSGFYNSVFNDEGKWIFSDQDTDGESRMYGPANYFAIVSGAADCARSKSILNAVQSLKCESGYRLFAPALGKVPMSGVGRIASGDMPDGLWENGNVYNHGSQGFLARALAVCGKGDLLKEVISYILPYSQQTHPVEKTLSAPYAVVNCYQGLPLAKHRGGMPFLTGTIAIAIRAVYEWMFGIYPVMDGLEIRPCLPSGKTSCTVHITMRNKRIKILYGGNVIENGEFTVLIDGVKQSAVRLDQTGLARIFVEESLIQDGSTLEINF